MNGRNFFKDGALASVAVAAGPSMALAKSHAPATDEGHVPGQRRFRRRLKRYRRELDRARVPVEDFSAITGNREGGIVLPTNETRNNIVPFAGDHLSAEVGISVGR